MLILSINQGWATRQVDFSKYFVQDTLLEYVYLALPYYYYYDTGEDRDKMFMKLNKSLNGLVQKSLYRYNNLKVYFEPRGFKPIPLYPFNFIRKRHDFTHICGWCVLLFGTDQDNIDEVIKDLEDSGVSLTVEEDMYNFLEVGVYTDTQSGKVTITQRGLTKKMLNIVRIIYSNNNNTIAATMLLGKYYDRNPFN